jgi:hypothetical protein
VTGIGTALAACAGLGAAVLLAPPRPAELVEAARWAVRPAVLPFAWRALEDAERAGDPAEAFARARHLMRLLPGWTDGYMAFAYEYVLAADERAGASPGERAERVLARLELATAWLADARARAGRHEPALLTALAFLPEVAVRHEPALAELLRPRGGAAALADVWLAEAERAFPTAALRERRTFHAPRLAAGLLAAGDRAGAAAVLETAVARSHDVHDRELAAEWRARLELVLRRLRGERAVDLGPVLADERFEPLHAFLL